MGWLLGLLDTASQTKKYPKSHKDSFGRRSNLYVCLQVLKLRETISRPQHWFVKMNCSSVFNVNNIGPSKISKMFCKMPSQIAHFHARALERTCFSSWTSCKSHLSQCLLWSCQHLAQLSGYGHAIKNEQSYEAHATSLPAVGIKAANGDGPLQCLAWELGQVKKQYLPNKGSLAKNSLKT